MGVIQLPNYSQVIFDESPLQEVVCQLRFHQILRIATAPPVDFQERIRRDFPVVAQEQGAQVAVAGGQPILAATSGSAWHFKSADEKWLTSVTSSFLALKTVAYSNFEDFLNRLLPVVQAFEETYKPSFYIRVGLRYVNQWLLPRENGQPVMWSDFLNNYIAGLFSKNVLQDGDGIAAAKHFLVLQTDRGHIGCRYARDIGEAEGKSAEQFTLDFDHYATGQIACEDVHGLLIDSNNIVYRLFRWCLTDTGYHSLKPRTGKPKGGMS